MYIHIYTYIRMCMYICIWYLRMRLRFLLWSLMNCGFLLKAHCCQWICYIHVNTNMNLPIQIPTLELVLMQKWLSIQILLSLGNTMAISQFILLLKVTLIRKTSWPNPKFSECIFKRSQYIIKTPEIPNLPRLLRVRVHFWSWILYTIM